MFEELLERTCECGRTHSLTTRDYIVERGAISKLPALLEKLGVGGKPLLVFDSNTRLATEGLIPAALNAADTLILEGDDIHPDEGPISEIRAAAPGHSVILAIGSGVINDCVRYVASQTELPYISVPTAASVDGYVSSSAVVTLNGAKKTLPAVAPTAVVADIDVIAAAPQRLTASGVGDMLSKYISIADWRVGWLVSDEYYCPFTANMQIDAVDTIMKNIDGIANGDTDAISILTEGLLLSGIAMQMVGITRPASSFEHHFSHYLEVAPPPGDFDKSALHGEKVGVSTLIAAKYYPVFANLAGRIFKENLPNRFDIDKIAALYSDTSPSVIEYVRKENVPNVTDLLNPELLRENYGKVMAIAEGLPSHDVLREALLKVGGRTSYGELGLTGGQFRDIMSKCCYIRNRFTLLRVVCDYELFDFDTMDD